MCSASTVSPEQSVHSKRVCKAPCMTSDEGEGVIEDRGLPAVVPNGSKAQQYKLETLSGTTCLLVLMPMLMQWVPVLHHAQKTQHQTLAMLHSSPVAQTKIQETSLYPHSRQQSKFVLVHNAVTQSRSSDDIHVVQNSAQLVQHAVEHVPEGLLGGCISNALPPGNAA